MKTIILRNVTLRYLVLCSATLLVGCGLTKAQLAVTQSFAKAAKSYPTAPGAVITTYADVYLVRRAFEISTDPGAGRIWNNSSEAANTYATEESDAKKLSAALEIVSQYGDLLIKLSSSDFSQAEEKAASSLSTSIDSNIKEYNKDAKSSVPSVGKYVAGGVAALGEIYIRKRQAEELKWYVNSAEPMVGKVTMDMNSYLLDFKGTILPGEECNLEQALCARQEKIVELNTWQAEQISSAIQDKLAPQRRKVTPPPKEKQLSITIDFSKDQTDCAVSSCSNERTFLVSPETAELVIEARMKIKLAQQAIDSAIDATKQMLKAHEALNSSLQQKETLAEGIEQIEQFVQAVSSANAKAKAASSTKAGSTNASSDASATDASSTNTNSTN